MRKQFVFILLVLLMLGTIMFFYVHNVLLPTKVKVFIEEQAQDYLQRQIVIENIDYKPFKGFTFSNIKIYEKDSPQLFFFADEARFNILFASLFRQKAILIPSLTLKNPSFHLIHLDDGSFNISQLSELNLTSKGQDNYTFLLGKLIIEDGVLDYTDRQGDVDFFDSYQNIQLLAGASLNRSVSLELSAQSPIKGSQIALKGKYDPGSGSFSAQSLFSHFPLSDYLRLFWHGQDLELNNLVVSSSLLTVEKNGPALQITGNINSPDASFRWDDFVFRGPLALNNVVAQFNEGNVDASGTISTKATIGSQVHSVEQSSLAKLNFQNIQWKNGSLNALITAELWDLLLTSNKDSYTCKHLNLNQIEIKQTDQLAFLIPQAHCDETVIKLSDGTELKANSSLDQTQVRFDDNKISIESALTLLDAKIKTRDNKLIDTNVSSPKVTGEFQDGLGSLSANLNLTKTSINLGKNRTFNGNPDVHIRIGFDRSQEDFSDYRGNFSLEGGQLTGIDRLGSIDNIKGNVLFDKASLSTKSLSFSALGTDFLASGLLSSFDELAGNFTIATERIDLGPWTDLFPELLGQYTPLITGRASMNARYDGSLKKLSWDGLELSSEIEGANVNFQDLNISLANLAGSINLRDNVLHWDNLKLTHRDQAVLLNGRASLIDHPQIATRIMTDQIEAVAAFTLMDETLFIDELKGRYSFSQFDASGRIGIYGDSDLSVKGEFDLADLNKLPENIYTVIAKVNPVGRLNYNAAYAGDIADWRSAQISLNALSDTARVINYPLSDVQLKYRQEDRSIKLFNLHATVYEGILNIDGEGSLAKDEIPFKSLTKLDEMNLIAYRKDKKTNNRYLSGKLAFIFNMEGMLLDPTTFKGSGKLTINDAYLGQLVPQLSEANFTRADADFVINNKRVLTENGQINSELIDLHTSGWVDFERNIDFDIIPALKETAAAETKGKLDPSVLLSKAVSLKMTGTLEHPVKKVNTSTAGVLKNTTGVIAEGIGNILGDLF